MILRLTTLLLLFGFFQAAIAQEFTSSLLPIIQINTEGVEIPDDPKIIAHMGIVYNGDGALNHVSDTFNHYDGNIAIEVRGSSSQQFPKKQYSIELRRNNGEDLDTALLGLPNEEDWILFAPFNDKSLMRDVLAYTVGAEFGRYAPRTKYCELLLNGQYQGVYVLIEKLKRDKNRVDIRKLDVNDVDGEDVTGGYLLKIDKQTGNTGKGWRSKYPPTSNPEKYIEFFFEYPDPAEVTSTQRLYISRYMDEFEDMLKSSNFSDPIDGYVRYIDIDSFVDYFLLTELTKNVDGYRLSTYFYKQHISDGGKLVMGPIWDYNLGFGNANYCIYGNPANSTKGLVVDFNSACPDDHWQVPFWWRRLLSDKRFLERVHHRWYELRADRFRTEKIHQQVDSIATLLTETGAQQRNFERWPVLGQWVWPNSFVGQSFEEEVIFLKNWIGERLLWMDEELETMAVTGLPQKESLPKSIDVFPNPSTEYHEYSLYLPKPGVLKIQTFTAAGQLFNEKSFVVASSGKHRFKGQASLQKGLFYSRLWFDGAFVGVVKIVRN